MLSKVFPKYRQLKNADDDFPDKLEYDVPELRTRYRSKTYLVHVICFFSIAINVILLYRLPVESLYHGNKCEANEQLSEFARIPYDMPVVWSHNTSYITDNEAERDLAWDAIDTDPVSITLSQEEIVQYNLPPSQPFPWDQSRGLYFLQSYHLLHCLKLVYWAYRRKALDGRYVPEEHIYHCLDNLRQYVACHADDTPMTKATDIIGEGQVLQCRDIKKLRDWTRERERNPCYRMVNDYAGVANAVEKYAYCAKDSPYLGRMRAYFRKFGHDVLFNDPVNEAEFRTPEELVV